MKQKIKGEPEVNASYASMEKRLFQIYNHVRLGEKIVTATEIKEAFSGKNKAEIN